MKKRKNIVHHRAKMRKTTSGCSFQSTSLKRKKGLAKRRRKRRTRRRTRTRRES